MGVWAVIVRHEDGTFSQSFSGIFETEERADKYIQDIQQYSSADNLRITKVGM